MVVHSNLRHVENNFVISRRGGYAIYGIGDGKLQPIERGLLDAAIRHAQIAGVLMYITVCPSPRQWLLIGAKNPRGVDISTIHHVHGIGRQYPIVRRVTGFAIDDIPDVAISNENHLGIFVRCVTFDKIAKIAWAEAGPVCRSSRHGAGRDAYVCRIRGFRNIGGAMQNPRCSQLVGHDTKHVGDSISSRSRTVPAGNVFHRARLGRADGHGILITIPVSPYLEGQADLFDVGDALRAADVFSGPGQHRQELGRERMARMAITTRSSTSVKASDGFTLVFFMVFYWG